MVLVSGAVGRLTSADCSLEFTVERACSMARSRYVFFAAPNFKHERQLRLETVAGIEVWAIDCEALIGAYPLLGGPLSRLA